MIDLDTIGYFLFMEEQEEQEPKELRFTLHSKSFVPLQPTAPPPSLSAESNLETAVSCDFKKILL